jgi:hypothetical protein
MRHVVHILSHGVIREVDADDSVHACQLVLERVGGDVDEGLRVCEVVQWRELIDAILGGARSFARYQWSRVGAGVGELGLVAHPVDAGHGLADGEVLGGELGLVAPFVDDGEGLAGVAGGLGLVAQLVDAAESGGPVHEPCGCVLVGYDRGGDWLGGQRLRCTGCGLLVSATAGQLAHAAAADRAFFERERLELGGGRDG